MNWIEHKRKEQKGRSRSLGVSPYISDSEVCSSNLCSSVWPALAVLNRLSLPRNHHHHHLLLLRHRPLTHGHGPLLRRMTSSSLTLTTLFSIPDRPNYRMGVSLQQPRMGAIIFHTSPYFEVQMAEPHGPGSPT